MNEQLFLEMHKAYLDARRHKRCTINQLKFERNLEAELLSLCGEIGDISEKQARSAQSYLGLIKHFGGQ